VRLTNARHEKPAKDQDTYEKSNSSEQLLMDQLEYGGQRKACD